MLETPMFGSELTDGGEFVILKEDKDLVIAGYASVDVVDKQNDKITLSAIQEAADKFMKEERYRNVMITHLTFKSVRFSMSIQIPKEKS